jgi:hypothetical protein
MSASDAAATKSWFPLESNPTVDHSLPFLLIFLSSLSGHGYLHV